uniref:(California timema) hypothetical protein n=1 Tax=Timema californicum TaxID=61474 RepID=A0A7R9PCF8_TIMCA|nr:unnamed protein product [Timema californicum]
MKNLVARKPYADIGLLTSALIYPPTTCGRPDRDFKGFQYILYDVNPLEGFNLRRDVYMRYAVLARRLQQNGDNWHLVSSEQVETRYDPS